MTKTRLAILFAAAFLLFLAATLPLGVAANLLGFEKSGLSYSKAEGTIWDGTLSGVVFQGGQLGRLDISADPLALAALRLRIDWALSGGRIAGRGVFERRVGAKVTLRDMVLDADLRGLATIVPVSGTLFATVEEIAFGANGCEVAEAVIETNALQKTPNEFDWVGPVLTGRPQCDGPRLVLPLEGAEGNERVAIEMWIRPDFDFGTRVTIDTENMGLRTALGIMGFEDRGGGYELVQRARRPS